MTCRVIAHRGASADAPENTLAAVRLGFEQGADGVEVDVHLTKDEQIVAIHDGSTGRVAGIDYAIAHLDYKDIAVLDVGSWKGEKFAGEGVPLLAEVAKAVPPGKTLFVEVKCGIEIIEPLCFMIGARVFDHCELAVISYNINVLEILGERHPSLETYIVADLDRPGAPSFTALMDRATQAACEGLDLGLSGQIDRDMVEKLHARNLTLHVWTVDDPEQARRLFDIGVRSITTNRPSVILETLGRKVPR